MVMEQPKSIGQRIRSARKERGLSVKELADKAGCLDEYLEWVEDGQVEPPVALLIRLAGALRLDSGIFLQAEDPSDRALFLQHPHIPGCEQPPHGVFSYHSAEDGPSGCRVST